MIPITRTDGHDVEGDVDIVGVLGQGNGHEEANKSHQNLN